MKKTPSHNSDPHVIAVLHRAGRVWRGVIASTKGSQPAITAVEEFSLDRAARIDSWLNEHRAGTVLCVLPAGAAICRNCPLPDASPEQLTQALRLQAEAHLLGIAPPHRLGMAVLPNAPGETNRTGLVLAWPVAATFTAPVTNRHVQYVPDIAALAALLDTQRPSESLYWMDRHEGSISLAITTSNGATFRSTREDASSPDDWQRSIGRIAAETALGAGHTGPFIEALVKDATCKAASLQSGEGQLFLPQELVGTLASRIQGAGASQDWWSKFGVAAGALLARTGPLNGLTHMLHAPPIERPSKLAAAATAMMRPATAAAVVVICALALIVSPLIFSGLRLAVLNIRFSDVERELLASMEIRQKVAMYRELENQKTWPMTKLLADIAGYTPVGIELESIKIDAGRNFAISGVALAQDGRSPAQLVALMQENLTRTSGGMFSDVVVNAGKTDNLGRYRFDLSANIAQPYATPELPEELDFATLPYVVRLYGESARGPSSGTSASDGGEIATTPPSTSRTDARSSDGPATSRAGTGAQANPRAAGATASAATQDEEEYQPDYYDVHPSGTTSRLGGGGAGANFADDRGENATVDPRAVPPPLNEEEISVMSRAELRDALAKVARARMNRDLDKDTQDRLREEQEMIMNYLRRVE